MRAVEQLLQSFAPSPEVAFEDVDVAWCEAVWEELQQALNSVMLQARERAPGTASRKRPLEAEDIGLLYNPHGRSQWSRANFGRTQSANT